MLDGKKILQAYKDNDFNVDQGDDVYNICYIEALNPDGTPNGHIPNHWDDTRIVWQLLSSGDVRINGAWEATTRAGKFFEIDHPMNPGGAFHIALGQQTAWVMGPYHDQTALIQTEPIHGTRDEHHDYERNGEPMYGVYGVHHHWGYDYPHDDLGRSSAGCQVGRTKEGHRQFIQILKTDKRYQENHQHVWTSTVLRAEDYTNATPSYLVPSTVGVVFTGGIVALVSYWNSIVEFFRGLF